MEQLSEGRETEAMSQVSTGIRQAMSQSSHERFPVLAPFPSLTQERLEGVQGSLEWGLPPYTQPPARSPHHSRGSQEGVVLSCEDTPEGHAFPGSYPEGVPLAELIPGTGVPARFQTFMTISQ